MKWGGRYQIEAGFVRLGCLFFGYEEDGGGGYGLWAFDRLCSAGVCRTEENSLGYGPPQRLAF